MKRFAIILGLALASPTSQAQIQITSFDRVGLLQWTNPIEGSATYRVELVPDITNRWRTLALVTNRTSLATTNPAAATNQTRFYRVAWVEGTPFTLECTDFSGSLVYTGRLYINLQVSPVFGSWESFGPTSMPPGLGGDRGRLLGDPYEPGMWLYLHPGVMDAGMQLHGDLADDVYLGTWGWDHFWGYVDYGTFVALPIRSPP